MAKACAAFSYSAALVASPAGAGLVGEHQRLPGGGLQLLHLAELPVEPHLQLPLVAQHRGGLVGQRLVPLLLGLDRLRDLDLRVGPLVDLGVGGGREVLPQLHERVGHGSSCSGAAAGPMMLVPSSSQVIAPRSERGPPFSPARVRAVRQRRADARRPRRAGRRPAARSRGADAGPGGTAPQYVARPGGNALNVAVAAGRLGAPVRLLARLGTGPLAVNLRRHAELSGVDLGGFVEATEPVSLAVVGLAPDGSADYGFHVLGAADWQWTDDELAARPARAAPAILHVGSISSWTAPGLPTRSPGSSSGCTPTAAR